MPTGETSARRRSTNKGAARRYETVEAVRRLAQTMVVCAERSASPAHKGIEHVFTNTSEHVYECTGVRECECTNVSTCAATARQPQRRDDRRAAAIKTATM